MPDATHERTVSIPCRPCNATRVHFLSSVASGRLMATCEECGATRLAVPDRSRPATDEYLREIFNG